MGRVNCSYCGKEYFKDIRHINENRKLGHRFYCSVNCQSSSKNKQVELTCENSNCLNKFKRTRGQMSFRNFCSQSCAAKVNNMVRIRNKLGISRLPKVRKARRSYKPFQYCQYCGNRCSSGRNYCSMKCWAKAHQISKEEIINNIKFLSLQLGRTPTKRECKHSTAAMKRFGSWNNALVAAGLTPHRSLNQRMYRRRRCISIDGHLCDSVSELLIDNWLYRNNINHHKSIPYPKGKFIADWSLGADIFIEYFGLANDSRRYDEDIKKKQEICKQAEITLIEVYAKDLFPENKLDQIFEKL